MLLQALPLPAATWERDVLPRRLGGYSPAWLDALCVSGELVWVGAGALGRSDGRVALYFREDARRSARHPVGRRPRRGSCTLRSASACKWEPASSPTCWWC